MGNGYPEKANVDRGEADFPCYPLVQSIFIILYFHVKIADSDWLRDI